MRPSAMTPPLSPDFNIEINGRFSPESDRRFCFSSNQNRTRQLQLVFISFNNSFQLGLHLNSIRPACSLIFAVRAITCSRPHNLSLNILGDCLPFYCRVCIGTSIITETRNYRESSAKRIKVGYKCEIHMRTYY